MNESDKDRVLDAIDKQTQAAGYRGLLNLTLGKRAWEQISEQSMTTEQARMLLTFAKLDPTAGKVLDESWLEAHKALVHDYIDHLYEDFALWCMTERPDLLRSGKQIMNDALPPEEQL